MEENHEGRLVGMHRVETKGAMAKVKDVRCPRGVLALLREIRGLPLCAVRALEESLILPLCGLRALEEGVTNPLEGAPTFSGDTVPTIPEGDGVEKRDIKYLVMPSTSS